MMQTISEKQMPELVEKIREAIIFGRLRPRERLVEDDLIEHYGATRHIVRSAMVALEQMGLVTRRPNRGYVVRDFSVEEVNELYEMRAILQAEAARRVPMPAPPALLSRLEEIHADYSRSVDALDLKRTTELNNLFHEVLYGACDNRYLAETIEHFWSRTTAIRCYAIGDPQMLNQSRHEHRAIIDALSRGDRDSFVTLCVAHIYPALEAYKRAHGGWQAAARLAV